MALILLTGAITAVGNAVPPTASAIVNGRAASAGQFPFVGSLHHSADDEHKAPFCTASLLTRRWAITAKHCADGEDVTKLTVRFGYTRLESPPPDAFVSTVDKVFSESYQEVALLKLSKPIDGVPTISLGAKTHRDSAGSKETPATAIGWGLSDYYNEIRTKYLRYAAHKIVDDNYSPVNGCIRLPWDNTEEGPRCGYIFTEPTNNDSGMWATHGDSGGPLAWRDPSTGKYHLLAVFQTFWDTSTNAWGDVVKVKDWIETTMRVDHLVETIQRLPDQARRAADMATGVLNDIAERIRQLPSTWSTSTTTSLPAPGPITTTPAEAAIHVSAGVDQTCAVVVGGSVRCWGNNDYGQLGDGTTISSSRPVAVLGISDARQVTTGNRYSCALLTRGGVKCWGYNGNGRLGDGSGADSSLTPVGVVGISDATQISSIRDHTCALIADGSVRCWGYNRLGQLGDGTTTSGHIPVMVKGISGVRQIAAGYVHTCALVDGGAIECWGGNEWGQLGDGTTSVNSGPVVAGISGATHVSAGLGHTCVVVAGGTVSCWGNGVGDGTVVSPTPTMALGVSHAFQVSAGYFMTCALVVGGSVACWGAGFLGNGTDTSINPSATPVIVSGISAATQVDAAGGGDHTCAVVTEGMVRCWGSNRFGQLGDGSLVDRFVPVGVTGMSG
jgi:alpha-tubulin suppressor-like RCC1 family protein